MKNRREILQAYYMALVKKLTARAGLVALILSMFVIAPAADAAQITSRSLLLGSSTVSAVTTYSFTFTVVSATAIQSVDLQPCTTPLGACTTPTGFTVTGDSLTAQPTNLGAAAGWTNSAATAGHLRLSDASNATAPSANINVSFSGVTNSSTPNTSFYVRITTYSGSNWSTGPLDTGNVAGAIEDTGDMAVNAQVAESLTFCVGQTGTSCSGGGAVSGNSATLSPNPLTTAGISTNTSVFVVSTNAGTGVAISYNAGQFTNGSHNFANGFGVGGSASSPGTEEFGLNAALTSGAGVTVGGTYSGANYAWNPASTTALASSAAAIGTNVVTVTYGANVGATTPFGTYATTFVYVATPTF
jgi:hypothetical protein